MVCVDNTHLLSLRKTHSYTPMAHRLIKIPPMLSATISMGIASLDGALFKEIGNCPHCGGRPMPYDTKTKNYATLILPNGKHTVSVKVRRYTCKECGRLLYAEEPFYPETRVGSAIVDLALNLSRTNTYSHAAAIMEGLGIQMNRSSVRNYALSELPMTGFSSLYGLPLPNSLISLMGKSFSGTEDETADVLRSSGYPSRYVPPADGAGTAAAFFSRKYEGRER